MFRRCILLLWLAALPAWAVLPDPVAFGVAVETGDLGRAGRWLDEGLPPDFQADRIGTGLMIGAWEGNIAMMELFLARGADIHRTNRFGEQALQLAAWKGHIEAVRWLLDRGAAASRKGMEWSALHYAVFAGRKEIARLLVNRGADVNARVPNGSTVLMMAAREAQEDLARMLVDAGADPRSVNDRGDSALTWAMRYGNFKIAKLMAKAEGAPAKFAEAVKAPPETFAKPMRSEPAPPAIEDILLRLRLAEAAGQPTEKLRRELFDVIAKFRKESTVVRLKDRPDKPRALVITARKAPGRQAQEEKAEIVMAAATPAQRAEAAAIASGDMGAILGELHKAQATGKPVADLRRALFEAVGRFKREGADLGPATSR
ncbi:MAG: ankyrin repeat domain-containing protein [Candidatus Nitricoxidivorans perseverans]|uniref:Ankyrin repeat domain-containing protein n=1 Tax=Candidatus Nitricoxidivorans perseverans TaxID=2975601 RepID=A0AA49FLQ0_9PROT|nr:MAG: ankyrin repeat domain-containing protein [Candidatus Nitricoxidivorans perseverans]